MLIAITKQLHATFGDSYHYYIEDIEQDLKKPCFTVQFIQPLQRSTSPILYDRTMPIVIHYFSDDKVNTKKDYYDIGEKAMEGLEYLPFENGLIRGEDLSWLPVDDVLEIFVTYKFKTRKVVDFNLDGEGNMEEIESIKMDSL